MKDINELVQEEHQVKLQILEINRQINRCVSDSRLCRLRVARQKKQFLMRKISEEVNRILLKT